MWTTRVSSNPDDANPKGSFIRVARNTSVSAVNADTQTVEARLKLKPDAAVASLEPQGVSMGLGDLVNKGKDLYEKNKDKIDDAVKGEKAEDISDKVLDAASDLAKKHVDEKHHDKIDSARDKADKAIGDK